MNTNVAAKRIMVFGDSLSWGYQPGTKHIRFDAQTRWPGALQVLLGETYDVIEENLNSRGIEHGDPRPGKEGRRALDYIEAALDSHDPLDVVIVMLGTNELKHETGMTVEQISEAMERLLSIIQQRPSQFRPAIPAIVLMSPPLIDETTEYCKKGDKYLGATEKSKALTGLYRLLADKLAIGFISLDAIHPGADGVHIEAEQHLATAHLVHQFLTQK